MKKVLVCILSLALLLALTACRNTREEQPPAEPEPPEVETTAPEPEPEQTATESSDPGLGLAGWKQSPNGTWYLGTHDPDVSASTPDVPQSSSGPISSHRELTPEEQNEAGEAGRKIYAGEEKLKFDEEGGYYYYE